MSRTVFALGIELEKPAMISPRHVAAALRKVADNLDGRGVSGIFGLDQETIQDDKGHNVGWYAIQVGPS